MHECYLYEKLKKSNVRCNTCSHRCSISPSKRGICGARENVDGKLYLLVYGRACAENIDPIEKKPFFHFLPGTQTFSVATVGCNFRCDNCQNWEISQTPKRPDISREEIEQMGAELLPEKIIQYALENNCPSISYTYTEPTIFLEYALDTMKLAKQKGLKNVWVSNGFMTKETVELVAPYLDAINVDLKSFDDKFYKKTCGARLQPILDNLKLFKQKGVWIEITTLVIPTLSDSEEMFKQIADFIKKEIGPETPWHVSGFSGWISWKLKHLPETPVEKLQKAYEIGKEAGLKYVYSGNIPLLRPSFAKRFGRAMQGYGGQAGLESENTYCPKCNALNIKRIGYEIERKDKGGRCYKCGENLDLIF